MNKTFITELNSDYTLWKRETKYFTEWVIAWGYRKESDSWCQGHYFSSFASAIEYAQSKGIL